jgi:ABC-type nitrate/sulfonate/bicarbonate transport system substrate-binding protein
VSKSFLSAKRDVVKRFLRGWVEGIKTAKTDKEFTIRVMQKFLKTSDRAILDKTFEVYAPTHERVPAPDPKVMALAIKQLTASVPQAAHLKADDFIDRSLIIELEQEGFISRIYEGR